MARVLIADSDPVVREAATVALQPHTVLTASDEARTLAEIGRNRPDVAVLGRFQGKPCCAETCIRIRNDPRLGRIPILMLCPSPKGGQDSCRCRGDRRLVRPFRGRDLAIQVDGLLNPRLPLD